jgi:hypothetical protein
MTKDRDKFIFDLKEKIAKKHDYQDNILGNRWDFAMYLTHRTKQQIALYDELVNELADSFLATLPEEKEEKIIYLITKTEQGFSEGTKPIIQDLSYWFSSGYRFVCHVTNDAITLSKTDIGITGEHCSYSENVINPSNQ